MKYSDFLFDYVNLFHYKCHQLNLKCSGSYMDSPNWIKKKRAAINPINNDDEFFQYTAAVALNTTVKK